MDTNTITKLMSDPKVRSMVQGLFSQGSKQGNSPNFGGLVSQLQNGGLNEQVQSWLGKGSNTPISGQQLQQALGNDTVDRVAQQAGTTPQQTADGLAQVLPQLVDKASPDGQLPDQGSIERLMSQFGQGRS